MTAVLGGLLAALGMCLSSFVSSFWLLYITFGFLSGLGSRMVYNSSTLVVLAYFVKWRSVTVGIIMSAASVGMFVMTQATQALLQSFGWPGALRGLAALLSVTSLCACVFDPHVSSQDCLEKNGAHKAVMRNSKLCDISLFMNRDFVIFSISATVVFLGYFVPSLHMVSLVSHDTKPISGNVRRPIKAEVGVWVKLAYVKPWTNGLASRHKFWTCVQLAFHLATHLRGLAWTCVDFSRAQIWTQVDASFLPFDHPAQVDTSNLLL